jgi:CheY-like chemotaxis protein
MIRVVLAEDQGMVLGAFASLLDLQPDITVVATATNGDDALAAVREHRPDVLVTDIEMPGRTGLDLAAELNNQGDPTRVLIVTTFARSGYLRRAVDAGVAGYVLKDSPIGELAGALRRVHAGERVVAPELAVAPGGGRSADRPGTRTAARGRGRGEQRRDRGAAVPGRGHGAQLPVQRHGQVGRAQPERGGQDRADPGLALTGRVSRARAT